MNYLNKRLKNLNYWDIALIKWSSIAAILFVITIWPAAMNWVHSVNPWHFLILFIILVARPFYRYYIK